jgi:FlaA1/EpsC-like NDP-sugar epimerase
VILQNNTFAGKSKIQRIIALIVLMLIFVVTLLWNSVAIDFGLYQLSPTQKLFILFAASAAYAVYNWLRFRQKYTFIYFTDDDKEHLVFRFYHIKLIGKKFTTYKIPIQLYAKYEISHANTLPELVLYQRTEAGKLAKYPPISLTALKSAELKELTDALDMYKKN